MKIAPRFSNTTSCFSSAFASRISARTMCCTLPAMSLSTCAIGRSTVTDISLPSPDQTSCDEPQNHRADQCLRRMRPDIAADVVHHFSQVQITQPGDRPVGLPLDDVGGLIDAFAHLVAEAARLLCRGLAEVGQLIRGARTEIPGWIIMRFHDSSP